jgi:hypothetical protein
MKLRQRGLLCSEVDDDVDNDYDGDDGDDDDDDDECTEGYYRLGCDAL